MISSFSDSFSAWLWGLPVFWLRVVLFLPAVLVGAAVEVVVFWGRALV